MQLPRRGDEQVECLGYVARLERGQHRNQRYEAAGEDAGPAEQEKGYLVKSNLRYASDRHLRKLQNNIPLHIKQDMECR